MRGSSSRHPLPPEGAIALVASKASSQAHPDLLRVGEAGGRTVIAAGFGGMFCRLLPSLPHC